MTRKDFQLIADTLKAVKQADAELSSGSYMYMVLRFSQELNKANDKFDVNRFMDACTSE